MKVRFAVSPGAQTWDDVVLPAFVDALEALGFDTVWLSDIPMGPQLDPLVGLAFAAGRTTRLKLGANLVPIGRNPMLVAKELAQLDRLSSGRVLLSLVPGLDQPGEREALGIGDANRGGYLDEVIPLLRRWWAGDAVEHHSERFDFSGVIVRPRPFQDPLEIWLGGVGPIALRRAGRLSDGWLGAAITPAEAALAVTQINDAAAAAGREIDPQHFGLSIPYARSTPDERAIAATRARRADGEIEQILPVGADHLRDLIGCLVDAGLSKFVLRPVAPDPRGGTAWRDELEWLADTVLAMQT
ncbi:MAG: putative oxidoreductase [Ilumatobacteraceae bacterium]|nr:putative oxidoreductase [Ilumatobacteraceae bacterium]